jgi:hypothetical protein
MKRAINKLGARAIPGNTKLGYALRTWQRDLIADLGGEDNVSIQQRTIVECAATTRLMIGSLDAWLMGQLTLMTKERKLIPVVMQRQALVDSLTRMLSQLGLKRVVKQISWQETLAAIQAESEQDSGTDSVNAETAQSVEANGEGKG